MQNFPYSAMPDMSVSVDLELADTVLMQTWVPWSHALRESYHRPTIGTKLKEIDWMPMDKIGN